MIYPTQTWSITGEYNFDNGGFKLLNPAMTVRSISIGANNNVSVSLTVKEDGGIYEHYTAVNYNNAAGEANLDVLVNAALAAAFPTATVTPELS